MVFEEAHAGRFGSTHRLSFVKCTVGKYADRVFNGPPACKGIFARAVTIWPSVNLSRRNERLLDGDRARDNGPRVNSWLIALAALAVTAIGASWYARRSGRRALLHFRARVDRFKLASRKSVRERLLKDPAIAAAVTAHAAETSQSESAVWK